MWHNLVLTAVHGGRRHNHKSVTARRVGRLAKFQIRLLRELPWRNSKMRALFAVYQSNACARQSDCAATATEMETELR